MGRCPGPTRPGSVAAPMPRSRLDRSSDAGNSLVGTLLALGLLLAMVTGGHRAMATTEGRPEPAARSASAGDRLPAVPGEDHGRAGAEGGTVHCAGLAGAERRPGPRDSRTARCSTARAAPPCSSTNGTHVGQHRTGAGTDRRVARADRGRRGADVPSRRVRLGPSPGGLTARAPARTITLMPRGSTFGWTGGYVGLSLLAALVTLGVMLILFTDGGSSSMRSRWATCSRRPATAATRGSTRATPSSSAT